jgi:predicted DNA-binding WGR domain protein
LVDHWGNIDEPGETRTEWFKTETQAKQARFVAHMEKAMAGYE